MKESKKISILEDAGKLVNEEEKKALDLLEIKTGIDGHHTGFKFKKAILDKDFVWELIFDIFSLPKRVNLYYKIHLILDPGIYNDALDRNYKEMMKNQLSLLDENNKYLDQMQKLHDEYKKDRGIAGNYTFETRLSELKNKNLTESLNFIVGGDVIRELERLNKIGTLGKMILVLENL